MQTIEAVITRLAQIVEESKQSGSPLGYFAALYKSMTEAVRDGIRDGRFDDPGAMEKLDVVFAKRYLDAFDAHRAGRPVTESWRRAFEAAGHDEISLFQHLLLGMNAHICLDLGIAAAECAPGQRIFSTEKDFLAINAIIASLTGRTEDRLAQIWWPFRLLRRWARTADEGFANFSIQTARGIAWQAARELAFLKDAEKAAAIRKLDAEVAAISQKIERPGGWLGFVAKAIRWGEKGSVSEKIGQL